MRASKLGRRRTSGLSEPATPAPVTPPVPVPVSASRLPLLPPPLSPPPPPPPPSPRRAEGFSRDTSAWTPMAALAFATAFRRAAAVGSEGRAGTSVFKAWTDQEWETKKRKEASTWRRGRLFDTTTRKRFLQENLAGGNVFLTSLGDHPPFLLRASRLRQGPNVGPRPRPVSTSSSPPSATGLSTGLSTVVD